MTFPHDDDDFRIEDVDPMGESLTHDSVTEFGHELDTYLAEAYMQGAIAVDVIWLADDREPIPEIVTWFEEPGNPEESVDGKINNAIRYDLEMIEPDDIIDVIEKTSADVDGLIDGRGRES